MFVYEIHIVFHHIHMVLHVLPWHFSGPVGSVHFRCVWHGIHRAILRERRLRVDPTTAHL
jgi:hypothetical protein